MELKELLDYLTFDLDEMNSDWCERFIESKEHRNYSLECVVDLLAFDEVWEIYEQSIIEESKFP